MVPALAGRRRQVRRAVVPANVVQRHVTEVLAVQAHHRRRRRRQARERPLGRGRSRVADRQRHGRGGVHRRAHRYRHRRERELARRQGVLHLALLAGTDATVLGLALIARYARRQRVHTGRLEQDEARVGLATRRGVTHLRAVARLVAQRRTYQRITAVPIGHVADHQPTGDRLTGTRVQIIHLPVPVPAPRQTVVAETQLEGATGGQIRTQVHRLLAARQRVQPRTITGRGLVLYRRPGVATVGADVHVRGLVATVLPVVLLSAALRSAPRPSPQSAA